ncbi:hypothetical protein SeLEV6574_g04102 [Synchytrium endobioticum]|uniref:Uncharacterized protein n=1 Tax=Synchytrium endobioticum TaxID=286115 RepID=A0A507D0W9_9FUNG|nr:hypothetical protein SeLEV6574_g04102 [Synchytrium endobioticum]
MLRQLVRQASSLKVASPYTAALASSRIPTFKAPLTGLPVGTASSFPRYSHGLVDKDLAHKLYEELRFEQENAYEPIPPFLKAFQNLGTFKVLDKPGQNEVSLTRAFGNEKITVLFSTDALEQEDAMDMEESSEGGPKEEAETEGLSLEIPITIVVDKKSVSGQDAGAIEFAATVQDDVFFVDSVSYRFPSTVVHDGSAEGDWQRRGAYSGPVFRDLDEDLQTLFHKFLEERGFDPTLADFIPNYLEYKEQRDVSVILNLTCHNPSSLSASSSVSHNETYLTSKMSASPMDIQLLLCLYTPTVKGNDDSVHHNTVRACLKRKVSKDEALGDLTAQMKKRLKRLENEGKVLKLKKGRFLLSERARHFIDKRVHAGVRQEAALSSLASIGNLTHDATNEAAEDEGEVALVRANINAVGTPLSSLSSTAAASGGRVVRAAAPRASSASEGIMESLRKEMHLMFASFADKCATEMMNLFKTGLHARDAAGPAAGKDSSHIDLRILRYEADGNMEVDKLVPTRFPTDMKIIDCIHNLHGPSVIEEAQRIGGKCYVWEAADMSHFLNENGTIASNIQKKAATLLFDIQPFGRF